MSMSMNDLERRACERYGLSRSEFRESDPKWVADVLKEEANMAGILFLTKKDFEDLQLEMDEAC